MKRFSLGFILFCSFGFALDIQSIQADFIQRIKSQPIAYEGRCIASSPSLAKWEYLQPLKKIVYVNASEVIAYEPMLSQVIIKKIKGELDFLAILGNAKQDLKDPSLYHSKIDNTTYTIHFKDNLPSIISYEDSLGETVIITLKNVIINQKIPQEVFKFEIPEGIDVVRD